MPPLLHLHGFVMSGWVVLLTLQAWLVTSRRVAWHRRVGVFGASWAGLVVILGSVTTIHAALREVRNHSDIAMIQVAITTLELVRWPCSPVS